MVNPWVYAAKFGKLGFHLLRMGFSSSILALGVVSCLVLNSGLPFLFYVIFFALPLFLLLAKCRFFRSRFERICECLIALHVPALGA